jgi:hypothetical protein
MNNINIIELIFKCPNCLDEVIIFENEINCGIFRHAIYKLNGKQIAPHASKEECNELINNNLIYGCAKPFQIIKKNNEWIIQKCDYI